MSSKDELGGTGDGASSSKQARAGGSGSRRARRKSAPSKGAAGKGAASKERGSPAGEKGAAPRRKRARQRGGRKGGGERVAIVAGLRTPFCKAGTSLASLRSTDLGVACVKELMQRTELDPELVTTCVYGQVVPSVDWINIAREVVIGAGLPRQIEAYSVSQACTTSIKAMTNLAESILGGHHDIGIAGGADSTTDIPLKVSPRLRDALMAVQKAKTLGGRLKALGKISPRDLLPGVPGFSREPTTGEQMGEAAEKMAKLNGIEREVQDRIALASHQNAARAWSDGTYAAEVMTIMPPPYDRPVAKDNIVRDDTSLEGLAKLKPVFDRKHGTITAGNASPLTDGAGALLLMRESRAKALGYRPLGFLRSWAYAAVDPAWQLLMAPVFAAPLALKRAGMTLKQMDLVDMHEAFGAQIACNLQAMASGQFAAEHLGLGQAVGEVDPDKLNVNGGSIALGHPFAATGARMVITTLHELRRRGASHALLTLCAGGGLGAALVLEAT
ncbi:MAG: acetyl-CoA C-acyltransferase FadI [Deltaproteobacteria bacterium]|nr:acetyl-CoA C-acyltransferase FadI [Deltaproteobacteria bacterium]